MGRGTASVAAWAFLESWRRSSQEESGLASAVTTLMRGAEYLV